MKERLQALMEQKIREWQRADIPKKFSCGEKKFGARQFIGFILCIMLVMFTIGIYDNVKNSPVTAPDMEESGQEDGTAMEPAQTEEPSREQDAAPADEEGEESAMQWQVYIHPDVPEPLAEVLEQYEWVMNAGWDSKVADDVKIELYYNWCDAVEEGRERSIYYSLKDLTGDGFPELIMGEYGHDVRIVYYCGETGDIQFREDSGRYGIRLYEGGILEYESGSTVSYWQFSEEEQDWQIVEALGLEWDHENDKEVELQWFSLCSPDWHIPVASGRDYDLYLEGISTDSWLNATMERQLYFSIYDKEGALVQELVETSPYLPYMPEANYAENTNLDGDEDLMHNVGNFYFQDMNFDGEEDLVLLWMNINHPHWKVYLWREEGVFREEPPVYVWVDGTWCKQKPAMDGLEDEGVFCYYNVVEEKKYIDEFVPEGDGYYAIYRMQYDEEWGYLCAGVLSVYYGDEGESQDKKDEKYQETFYEDGILAWRTEIISQEEVSDLWSDLWE